MSELRLNFLPLSSPLPKVEVYAKEAITDSIDEGDYRWYPLEAKEAKTNRPVIQKKEDYDKKTILLGSKDRPTIYLTLNYIRSVLVANARKCFGDLLIERKGYVNFNDVTLCIEKMRFGRRVMRISLKHLQCKDEFGLVLKEEYWKDKDTDFGKSVLIESGSYDAKGRPNAAYHQEALARVGQFIKSDKLQGLLADMYSPFQENVSFKFEDKFVGVDFSIFDSRSFQVGDDRTVNNCLKGVEQYGPYEAISHSVRLLFIGRESDKPLSRVLYKGLIEGNEKVKPQSLFRMKLEIHPNKYLVINDFEKKSLEQLEKTISNFGDKEKENTIVFAIMPSKGSDPYFRLKSLLMRQGLSSQFCTSSLISNPYTFKWSLANIALGVFAKSGGVPWRVKPHGNKAVIIGVGQAVGKEVDGLNPGKSKIIRHKTFSVSTDSTGEFLELNELATGETDLADGYVASFREGLKNVLTKQTESNKSSNLFVVHTPFNLSRSLMVALEDTVKEFYENERANFMILKFNSEADNWFGYSTENNRVPTEGSYCSLSDNEYLIWFEGANRYTKQVHRRCGTTFPCAFPRCTSFQRTCRALLKGCIRSSGSKLARVQCKGSSCINVLL